MTSGTQKGNFVGSIPYKASKNYDINKRNDIKLFLNTTLYMVI